MRITDVVAIPLAIPAPDETTADQTQEAVILRVETDEGLTGFAEINHTPAAVCGFLDATATSNQTRGVRNVLIDRDPREIDIRRSELILGNQSSSRRGCGLALLNAVDVALWDIAAQAEGVPLWHLLWGEKARPPQAYLTLYTGPSDYLAAIDGLEEFIDHARAIDCRSYKIEPLDDCVPEDRIGEFVGHARALVGEEADILVDVYQRFADPESAARCVEELMPSRPLLIETPLLIDDLRGYARLAELIDLPIAGAELFESHWEFAALLEHGRVDIAQPWANRVGVTGFLSILDHARSIGRDVMVAGWNATPIGNLLGIHLAAGLGDNGLVLEYAPGGIYGGGFALREIGASPDDPIDGRFALPTTPGLGVELDDERFSYYAGVARGVS